MIAWYNGYSPRERNRHAKVGRELIAAGKLKPASGRCAICGDAESPVESHAEDYSTPHRWRPPAEYVLRISCHRVRLHQRFKRPEAWMAFLAHVRRGGYGREMRLAEIKLELREYSSAVEQGKPATLRQLRPYAFTPGTEWFARLRMDAASLRDPAARPR